MPWPFSRRRDRLTFDGGYTPVDDFATEALAPLSTSVNRQQALSVPAIRRGRNELCAIATMPLESVDLDDVVQPSALLRQLDLDVPNVVVMAQTIEDLIFDAIGWWRVVQRDPNGYPVAVRRLAPDRVSLQPPSGVVGLSPLPSGVDPRDGVVWIDGRRVPGREVIRFDSPNPGLLSHGGREVRRAIALDQAAAMYAADPRPLDYFKPAENAQPIDDAEVAKLLGRWRAARRRRATGYVPAALTYNTVDSPAPRDLQLAELQKQASIDIANGLGIDPEDLGISTTSRTYANDVDRRRNKLNDVLAPYMRAITDRLSMGDVTPRTRRVRFNTTDYLLPNPTDRWNNYRTARELDVISRQEVRDAEGLGPMPAELKVPVPPPPGPAPALAQPDPETEATPVDAAQTEPSLTFSASDDGRLTFVDLPVHGFSVDREGRVIEGMVVPYAGVAVKNGLRFRFTEGSLQWNAEHPGRVKLLRDHDDKQAIGVAIALRDTPDGMLARFKVARGTAGDEALSLAEDGVLDGLSVGVDFGGRDSAVDPSDRSVTLVRRANLREVSLVAMPAFDDARVTTVAASRGGSANNGGQMPENSNPAGSGTPDTGDQDGAAAVTDTLLTINEFAALKSMFRGDQESDGQPVELEVPADDDGRPRLSIAEFMALQATLTGQAAPEAPERPEVVNPNPDAGRVTLNHEPLPYQFDRGGSFLPGEHVFSADLHTMSLARDVHGTETDAGKRVMALMAAVFDPSHADHSRLGFVSTGDINETTPAINLPGMYVDQRDYRTPLWEAVNKGTPPNGVQPFMFPKFSSASGLVAAHVEGTEPTPGTFVTTGQTVTPSAISGKAVITREVWDMGGNPAVSTLIFQQMVRGYREGLESATATFLNTLTAATDITLGVAVVDEALIAAWDTAVADLQFERGYDFSMFAIERYLYRAFVNAVDNNGRKLVPQINPTDASGRAARRFATLDLAGVEGVPSWALSTGASGALNNSWLFDPQVIWGWATAPQRLEFPGSGATNTYTPVATVDLAIWGYRAFANTDIGGVRQVTYDNA